MRSKEIGPYYQPDTLVVKNDGYTIYTAPDYHVRTTIPENEREEMDHAIQIANTFALGNHDDDIPSFATQVCNTYVQQTSPRFTQAIETAMYDFIGAYNTHYPDSVKGFQAAFSRGGIGGMRKVVEATQQSLKKAVHNPSIAASDLNPFSDQHYIQQASPNRVNGAYEIPFEIQCPPPIVEFSKTLIDQINTAAIELAHTTERRNSLFHEEHISDDFNQRLMHAVLER